MAIFSLGRIFGYVVFWNLLELLLDDHTRLAPLGLRGETRTATQCGTDRALEADPGPFFVAHRAFEGTFGEVVAVGPKRTDHSKPKLIIERFSTMLRSGFGLNTESPRLTALNRLVHFSIPRTLQPALRAPLRSRPAPKPATMTVSPALVSLRRIHSAR